MAVVYKQKCSRCKKNYVTMTYRQMYVTCYDCQKAELNGKVTDPVMKKMFAIKEEYYMNNGFLRSIKINYLKYGKLSEAQVEAFKKTVDKLNGKVEAPKPKEKKKPVTPTTPKPKTRRTTQLNF